MPNKMVLLGIAVLSVVIIVAGVSWTVIDIYSQPKVTAPSSTPPQSTTSESAPLITPEPSNSSSSNNNGTSIYLTPDQIRDLAMTSLATSHPETAPLVANLTWSGGFVDSGSTDNETYLYYSSGWQISLECPIPNPMTYTVTGTYNSDTMFVAFTGVYQQTGAFTITSYSEQTTTPTPQTPEPT